MPLEMDLKCVVCVETENKGWTHNVMETKDKFFEFFGHVVGPDNFEVALIDGKAQLMWAIIDEASMYVVAIPLPGNRSAAWVDIEQALTGHWVSWAGSPESLRAGRPWDRWVGSLGRITGQDRW